VANYTQDNRLLQVDTPLGKDVLLLRDFVGTESISHPFHFHLEMLSRDSSIDYKKIVGQKISVVIQLPNNKKRYISGHVSRFCQSHITKEFSTYEAELVPWFWFLSRTADCRVFQDKNVQDIVTKIFEDLGFQDFKFSLQSSYQPLVYCVQYRESDLNFVSRLLEQHGKSLARPVKFAAPISKSRTSAVRIIPLRAAASPAPDRRRHEIDQKVPRAEAHSSLEIPQPESGPACYTISLSFFPLTALPTP